MHIDASANTRRVRCAARGVLSMMHTSRAYSSFGPRRGSEVQCARTVLLHLLLSLSYYSWVRYYVRTMLWAFWIRSHGLPLDSYSRPCSGSCLWILHVSFPCCRFQLVHCILVAVNLIPCIGGWQHEVFHKLIRFSVNLFLFFVWQFPCISVDILSRLFL